MQLQEIVVKIRVWGLAGIVNFFRRKYEFFVQSRRLELLVAKSESKIPIRGITVIGDLTARVSLSKTLRDFILDLKEAGIPCQAYDTRLRSEIPAEDSSSVLTPISDFDVCRYSHVVMMYRSPLPKAAVPNLVCARIAFHESEHGIHETAPYLRESGDAIIAMSDFNFDYYKKAFEGQPVYKITYPFRFKNKKSTPRDALRKKYGINPDDFVVFFNFDFGSYYRKNIPAAIRAFAIAFKRDPKAKLLFKTKGAKENPRQAAEMMQMVVKMGVEKQFVHIADYLPRADVDGLTSACDVYMSLHKAEGFGIGMAEAMSQGKPVVATNWSANTEFCRPDTAWCVPYKMVPILPHEYPPAMIEWADADVSAAAEMLREIRSNPEAARARAESGVRFMNEHFSLERFKADVERFLERNNA